MNDPGLQESQVCKPATDVTLPGGQAVQEFGSAPAKPALHAQTSDTVRCIVLVGHTLHFSSVLLYTAPLLHVGGRPDDAGNEEASVTVPISPDGHTTLAPTTHL